MRILIADDFDDCATTSAVLLRTEGHAVQIVKNGPAVLNACRDELPDAILLDIALPGLDGYEVAKRLRHEFGASTPRLIALTGFGRPDDRRKSRAAGIDVHLVKPVLFDKLNSALGTERPSLCSNH